MVKKKGRIIGIIIVVLAVVALIVYLICSTGNKVVNISISDNYDSMCIVSGGNGKPITPDKEQQTKIIEMLSNINMSICFPSNAKGWRYRIEYYIDGKKNKIVFTGKEIQWNGRTYKPEDDEWEKLIEYIDTLMKS